MTVFGWDASDFDWPRGPMDLVAAKRAGIEFFTHKATEKTNVKHVHYGEALNRARAAGITVLGAYHVVRSPTTDTEAEVNYFLNYVNQQTPWWKDHPYWFWQVDLEKWPYDSVPAAEGVNFARIVQQKTGRKAIIYASRGQYGNELTGSGFDLWNANYGSNPTLPLGQAYVARGGDRGPGWVTYSGKMPVFWQFGSRITIGRQPISDGNAFRGTLDDLKKLINPKEALSVSMFCRFGDGVKNGKDGEVWVLRSDLLNAGFGVKPDGKMIALNGEYDQEVADALVRSGVCGGDKTGKTYWAGEYAGLQRLLHFAYARQAAAQVVAEAIAALPETLKGEKGDPGLVPGDRIVSVIEKTVSGDEVPS